ncbi:DUF4097 family beta strand repeat-containing protein [Sediminibacillus massiliensis]|uniref:DUF4097 family beta strand repeat-containing protein n=1 Tax=Sediminibacillus massiliensis TaxID=1926277 RepID=UPI00098856EA|nr:DUF4097 domain-containing protein [Sediminibacillus massiliensis]
MNEERRKILKMLEDGIVTSEEAEELLESMDQADKAQQQAGMVSTNVNWNNEQEGKGPTTSKKRNNFFSYVEQAFNKIKNVDLDFNFGTHYPVSHIFHHQSAELSKLDIDIANGEVDIIPWNESDIRIECEAKVYQVADREKAREKFLREAEFRIMEGILQFYIPSQQVKTDVKIKIPSQLYQKVSAKLFNGGIRAENLHVTHFRGKTTNGTIDIKESQGDMIEAETVNGSVKIRKGKWDHVDAETINGSVRLQGRFSKTDAQVVNGSIHCDWDDAKTATVGFLKTATGSIRLRLPDSVRIDGQLETKIGGIHCDLHNYRIIEEKKEMINKSMHFEANTEQTGEMHVEAETKTGSIWVLPSQEG